MTALHFRGWRRGRDGNAFVRAVAPNAS